jgi:hypothetical protein
MREGTAEPRIAGEEGLSNTVKPVLLEAIPAWHAQNLPATLFTVPAESTFWRGNPAPDNLLLYQGFERLSKEPSPRF